MKEKGFSDYSDSDSKIWHFSIFLGLGFAKIDCQITFSQVAAVVYSDYSYSGSIQIPGKLQ